MAQGHTSPVNARNREFRTTLWMTVAQDGMTAPLNRS